MEKNIRLGDVLRDAGYITDAQLMEALDYQRQHRDKRIGEVLMEMGLVEERQMLEALGKRLGLAFVEISHVRVEREAVEMIPRQLAEKYHVLAVARDESTLTVATNDPLNFYGLEDIGQVAGLNLRVLLAETVPLDEAIRYQYSDIDARRTASSVNRMAEDEVEELAVEESDDDAPIIQLMNQLIDRSYSINASDIHVEPFEAKSLVRMRVDGQLVEYVTLQKSIHQNLIARIKILANLDIAEKRLPQDGHFRYRLDSEDVNLRVSIMPTVFGEKAVLRLLNTNSQVDNEGHFGMEPEDYEVFSSMLEAPNGIVYITGPTGSGKTTTLYMAMGAMSKRKVNISTIEDPVEQNLPRVNQSQVNLAAGMTFERGLRALLRQDPDVIMLGETRDSETASISVRAAITGHLVLSTLHTNDAVASIIRLVDMGVEPYLVANSLVGIVAQRLMRKVCPECARWESPTAEEKEFLDAGITRVRRAVGCNSCGGTGYRGRRAIHEILTIDPVMRRMITTGAGMDEIRFYAENTRKMRPLKKKAEQLVKDGITTVEELKKVAYYL